MVFLSEYVIRHRKKAVFSDCAVQHSITRQLALLTDRCRVAAFVVCSCTSYFPYFPPRLVPTQSRPEQVDTSFDACDLLVLRETLELSEREREATIPVCFTQGAIYNL